MLSTDLDDVIIDTHKLTRDELLRRTGFDVGMKRDKYYVTVPGYTNEEIGDMIGDILKTKTLLADEIPGSIKSLQKIFELTKKEILIITAREPYLSKVTNEWLKEHVEDRFPYRVVFTNHKSKNDFFNEDTKFFIDDHPYFVREASKVLDRVFLMDKSWNRKITLYKNITRIKNIEEVYIFLKYLIKIKKIGIKN